MSRIRAVYGVMLTPEDCKEVNDFHDGCPGSYPESELERYKAKYNVPADADIYYTDSEDDRPFTHRVPAESWILGYPLGEFPRDVDEEFKKRATWWLWVVEDE